MTRVLGFFVHNWPLKLAALLLASLLYGVFVLTQDSRQIPGSVPIEALNQPPDIVLVSNLGEVTNIRYIASDDRIPASSRSFRAYVDFRSVAARAGSVVLSVTVESIDERIDVLSWEPRQISVNIDELVSREVPVRVVRGEIPPGLEVREPELSAATVRVRGASGDVARVDRAEARVTIDPNGIHIDREVTLVPVDAQGEAIPQVVVEPSAVRVQIAVFTDRRTRSVPITPVLTGQPAPGFEIAAVEVSPLVVTLEGNDEDLRPLARIDTEPIAVNGASDTFSRTVSLALPTGVLSIDGDEVRVTVSVRLVTGTRTFNAGIVVEGQRPDLEYRLSRSSVLVTIGGSTADLDRLEGRSFNLEVSAAGLGPGEHELELRADLPAGLTLVAASPPTVRVTILEGPPGDPQAPPSPSPTAPSS